MGAKGWRRAAYVSVGITILALIVGAGERDHDMSRRRRTQLVQQLPVRFGLQRQQHHAALAASHPRQHVRRDLDRVTYSGQNGGDPLLIHRHGVDNRDVDGHGDEGPFSIGHGSSARGRWVGAQPDGDWLQRRH
jgi:hypothetical protein